MKRYLAKLALFAGTPIVILSVIYFITDPFCVMKPFSLDYFDDANRDYTSVELFMMNKDSHHYNSFIFGSCGLGGINSYHWQSKLNPGDEQFVFQSWGETLTGIEDKIVWLHENNIPIDNAMIMIDIPSSFSSDQLSSKAVLMHDPKMSRVSRLKWHWDMYLNFLQKPSFWIESVHEWYDRTQKGKTTTISFDTTTNDMIARSSTGFNEMPKLDSMRNITSSNLSALCRDIEMMNEQQQEASKILITEKYEKQLRNIRHIFDACHTNYRIFIKPGIYYTSIKINADDFSLLQSIFGESYVFDYSGKNEITYDLNHYYDNAHFGLSAGWLIVEEMYESRPIKRYE